MHMKAQRRSNRRCAALSRSARVDCRVGATPVRGVEDANRLRAEPREAAETSEAAAVKRRAGLGCG